MLLFNLFVIITINKLYLALNKDFNTRPIQE